MRQFHAQSSRQTIDADPANIIVAYLAVDGLECQHCVKRVTNSFLRLEGVLACSFDEAVAAVVYLPKYITIADLLIAVFEAGGKRYHPYRAWFVTMEPAAKSGLW
ncbi:MAG: heavy-metal-associated domain-containing protein [Anaerolineae bacterium]|nr:heavy-metal-associated domain-containing protein [Anaerolineae bacterium]